MESPFPKDQGYEAGWIGQLPRLQQPMLLFTAEDFAGDQRMWKIVEVYPHEVPEFQALRDEEVWLQDRIEQLEEHRRWLEGDSSEEQ